MIFRGVEYSSQKKLFTAFCVNTKFSISTLNDRIAKARKKGELTEGVLEKLLFGEHEHESEGGWLYRIVCKPTGQIYYGITVRSVFQRWNAHVSEAKTKDIDNPIKSAIRRFGKDAFDVEEIAFIYSNKDLKQLEKEFIEEFQTQYPRGLNANMGGTLGALDIMPFEFRGKKYRSQIELAHKHNLNPGTLKSRIRLYGMSLEEAIDAGQPFEIQHDGKTYSSQIELAIAFGLDPSQLKNRLSRGTPLDEALQSFENAICLGCGKSFNRKRFVHKYCSAKCKELAKSFNRVSNNIGKCIVCGKTFQKKSSVHIYCSQNCRKKATAQRRSNGGIAIGKGYSVTVFGKRFPSLNAVAKHYKISRTRLASKLRAGLTPEEAIKPQNKKISIIYGREFLSDVAVERYYKINRSAFRRRIIKGMKPEKALEELLEGKKNKTK